MGSSIIPLEETVRWQQARVVELEAENERLRAAIDNMRADLATLLDTMDEGPLATRCKEYNP